MIKYVSGTGNPSSAAAACAVGGTMNGRKEWKYADGKSIRGRRIGFLTHSVNETDNPKGAVRFLLPCCAFWILQDISLKAKIKSSPETALYFYHIYIRRENNGLGNDLRLKMISFRYIPQRISDRTDRKRNRRGSSRGR